MSEQKWLSKHMILNDLQEVTGTFRSNTITAVIDRPPIAQEEIEETLNLEDVDPQSMYSAPDLESITEMLSMLKADGEPSEESSSETLESLIMEYHENNSIQRQVKPDGEPSDEGGGETASKLYNTAFMLNPASMFKKKSVETKKDINEKKVERKVEINEKKESKNTNIYRGVKAKDEKSEVAANYADELYREFKSKKEASKRAKSTVWTQLLEELEKRDKEILAKRKEDNLIEGSENKEEGSGKKKGGKRKFNHNKRKAQ